MARVSGTLHQVKAKWCLGIFISCDLVWQSLFSTSCRKIKHAAVFCSRVQHSMWIDGQTDARCWHHWKEVHSTARLQFTMVWESFAHLSENTGRTWHGFVDKGKMLSHTNAWRWTTESMEPLQNTANLHTRSCVPVQDGTVLKIKHELRPTRGCAKCMHGRHRKDGPLCL